MTMFEFLFLNTRLKAIEKSNIVLRSNPYTSSFSMNQIKWAAKNRQMNQKWFVRNYARIKTKFTDEEVYYLSQKLGFDVDFWSRLEYEYEKSHS